MLVPNPIPATPPCVFSTYPTFLEARQSFLNSSSPKCLRSLGLCASPWSGCRSDCAVCACECVVEGKGAVSGPGRCCRGPRASRTPLSFPNSAAPVVCLSVCLSLLSSPHLHLACQRALQMNGARAQADEVWGGTCGGCTRPPPPPPHPFCIWTRPAAYKVTGKSARHGLEPDPHLCIMSASGTAVRERLALRNSPRA